MAMLDSSKRVSHPKCILAKLTTAILTFFGTLSELLTASVNK
jgi:hypothetical protein